MSREERKEMTCPGWPSTGQEHQKEGGGGRARPVTGEVVVGIAFLGEITWLVPGWANEDCAATAGTRRSTGINNLRRSIGSTEDALHHDSSKIASDEHAPTFNIRLPSLHHLQFYIWGLMLNYANRPLPGLD